VCYSFILSGSEASDVRNGRLLLDAIGRMRDPDEEGPLFLLMDVGYHGELEFREGRQFYVSIYNIMN
jgi:hypothetical protein